MWGLSGSNTCWERYLGPRGYGYGSDFQIYPNKFVREYESIRLYCDVYVYSDSEPSLRMEFDILGISCMPKNIRKRRYGKMPLRVGLWSWAEYEGRKTLHHDMEYYRRTRSRGWALPTIEDAEAEALIRKLHRADYVGWTMDNTGESSELAVIDERLREQIGILMKRCGIDPGPAPQNSPAAPRITNHESPNTAFQPAGP